MAAFAGNSQPSADKQPRSRSSVGVGSRQPRGLPLAGVSPLDFRLGTASRTSTPTPQSTVVACATGHSAQLVAVEKYGIMTLSRAGTRSNRKPWTPARRRLTDKAGNYDLSYKLAYPSSRSWDRGDRRVDCYAAADAGNVIKESLLP